MAKKTLVVVESPTKARTIKKFLGKDYVVESCMGHVRDLPQSAKDIPEKFKKLPWSNLGVNVDKDFDPIYCIPKNKTKIVKELKALLKDADELILATDEDREGESISWHLLELLNPKVPVKRMVFHEITKKAIQEAIDNCREVDMNLVKAQEARRVLDRLVGYTISPLLWKKVAYGLSAGRVQSVAVRLIVEKEHERLKFKQSKYWGVYSNCEKTKVKFEAKLIEVDGKKIATGKDFDPDTGQLKDSSKMIHIEEKRALTIVDEIKGKPWAVTEVEERPVSRKPAPPFITSTLQQDANRKLGLSARETMSVAQKLYERGFITYMRTDSTNLSNQAIEASRACIKDLYGSKYLPEKPREYNKKKSKGAQEAHEAIRPAGVEFVKPEDTSLKSSQLALYDLIWKRTVACQMVNAQQNQVGVKFSVGEATFSASGMTIVFPGFLKAYVEGKDDPEGALEDREVRLPKLKKGDGVECLETTPKEHETKPPARYTEAGLVQKMEKEGIGRPSTYASIIGTIQDRGYARKVGNTLVPTFTALVVVKLLRQYLPQYVDLGFTSEMEKSLDNIAQGDLDQVKYLKGVYFGKTGLKEQVEAQEKEIKPEESRQITLVGLEGLSFRVGRFGAYVCRIESTGEEVCASIPDGSSPAEMTIELANKFIDQKISGNDALGEDPESGLPIFALSGRYGPYVQLGDAAEIEKPKRMALPATWELEEIDIPKALFLLSLPKTLGEHPETKKVVKVGIGRFGPYVVHDGDFRSVNKAEDLRTVDFAFAMNLLSQEKKGRGKRAPLKVLGAHPETGDEMQVLTGRYGPYIKCGKVNVSLPEEQKPEDTTVEQALELLKERLEKATKKKKAKKKTAKKKVAKKAAKKTTTKKTKKTAKKTAKKKVVIRREASTS